MFFETHERILEERPWEDNRRISKDEARQVCRDAYKKGLVISIFDCGTDSDGKFPLNFCFCNAFDCQAYKARAYRGATVEFNKGESVCVVDPVKCAAGCKNEAPCIMKCQYGGIQYSPLRDVVTINQFFCFGFGLCRTACKYGALKLVDRLSFPSLVDVW
jgi:NAD-dependent dihydropyrimidine dehydrogenase PreA subunit